MKQKTIENTSLRVLCLDHSSRDAEIMGEVLRDAGYDLNMDWTATEEEYVSFLRSGNYDIILSDFRLSGFDAFGALRLSLDICRDIPFICVSGSIGEETAIELIKQGAVDYVSKDRMARLPSAIKRAIEEAKGKGTRRRAEEALHESEERYRLLFNSSMDAVLLTSPSGDVFSANPAACKMFGRTEEEICANGRKGIVDATDPRLAVALEDRARTGEFIGELTLIRKDGTTFPAEISTVIYNDKESPNRSSMIIRDISERKRAEEALAEREKRYRTLFDLSPAGIVLEDTAGNIIDVNDSLCRTLGYSREALIGKNVRVLMRSDDHDVVGSNIAEVLSGKVLNQEVENIGKDGSIHRMELRETLIALPGNKEGILVVSTDITERKGAEKALRESEERYHSLFDRMMDGVYRSTHDGRFVEVNPAMVKMFGFASKEEMLKVDITKDLYFAPSERDSLFMDTGQERTEIFRMRHKDGGEIWVEDHGTYVHDEKGKVIFHEGILRDVTARLIVEDALRKSEEKYKDIFTWAPVGIYQSSPDGKLSTANKSLANMLGYDAAEDLVNRDMAKDIYYNGEDRQKVIEEYGRGEQGSVANLEILWKKKDGTPIWIMLTAHAIKDKKDTTVCYEGFVHDITERKRAEENILMLSRAIEQSPASIVITDLEGKIEYVNPKFTEVTGYDFQEALGQNPRILKSGEKPFEEYKQLWETIASGEEWQGEFHNKKKNGELYWESASISPIKDASGRMTHYLAVKEDITEKKSLQTQLLRAQRMESLGTLAGGVAHDLNNVLAPIVLSIELLKQAMQDELSQKLLETLEASAHRGSEIIKQILGFARGVRGESAPIQFRHVIDEMATIVKGSFPKSIAIEEDVRKDIWPIVGDPTSLHQLMLNLCVNARDAMPNGGTIRIKAENKVIDEHYHRMNPGTKPGRYVTLSIEDTGCGMPPNVLEHIFEPFFTTKEIGKGTGLGLSTALAIVKSHGGSINVYSEVGKGTTFNIYLPAAKETGEIKPSSEKLREMFLGHGELIMVVDDENSIRQIARQTLETYGYRVITASDGAEAVPRITTSKEEIALVLTDMIMPYMDGPKTIQAIRKIRPAVKIVASSGLTDEVNMMIDKDLRVNAFLVKPYTAEKLLETVHSVLH